MSTGLTLGKFAPLHRGHQLLIETALAENDHLVVMVYDAPETGVPLAKRVGWIRRLYPQVEVIECIGGPQEVGLTPEITAAHDAYILSMLRGRTIDAFYSSEPYGGHVSRALGARDRQVDPGRERVPVSARRIRDDAYAYRSFIDPRIYRDLVTKVVLVGAPCTGKTTLARACAEHFRTVWVPEYGREYTEGLVDDDLTPEQFVEIAEGHRRREDELILQANRVLFVDTDARITRLFSRHYRGAVHPRLDELADEAATRYDLTLLCEDDVPYEPEGRVDLETRTRFQRALVDELTDELADELGSEVVRIGGNLPERLARIVDMMPPCHWPENSATSRSESLEETKPC